LLEALRSYLVEMNEPFHSNRSAGENGL